MSCCRCSGGAGGVAVAGPGAPGGTLPPAGAAGAFLQSSGGVWVPSTWILPQVAPVAGDIGKALVVNAAGETEFQTLFDRMVIIWTALALTNGTTFMWPSGDTGTNSSAVSPFAVPAPFDGTLRRARSLHNILAGVTNVVYTFQVNEVDTALTWTVNSGTQAGNNLVDNVNFSAGDRLRLKASNTSGATLSIRPLVLVELWTPQVP
jgi:hypothetical protein